MWFFLVLADDLISLFETIDKRLVIRRASVLTLYWDIFRDYVVSNVLPVIRLDYIPQQQYAVIAKFATALLSAGRLTVQELSNLLGYVYSTTDNVVSDAVMFGIAEKADGHVVATCSTEREVVRTLQSFFKSHIVYTALVDMDCRELSYSQFATIFNNCYAETTISDTTRSTYCSKLFGWLLDLGFVVPQNGFYVIVPSPESSRPTFATSRSKRPRYLATPNGGVLFWGQTTPDKISEAHKLICGGVNSYNELKNMGLRGALEVLSATGCLRKMNDIVEVTQDMDGVLLAIKRSATIHVVQNMLKENPHIKGPEVGEILSVTFNTNWGFSSKRRYGNALLKWTKWLFENKLL